MACVPCLQPTDILGQVDPDDFAGRTLLRMADAHVVPDEYLASEHDPTAPDPEWHQLESYDFEGGGGELLARLEIVPIDEDTLTEAMQRASHAETPAHAPLKHQHSKLGTVRNLLTKEKRLCVVDDTPAEMDKIPRLNQDLRYDAKRTEHGSTACLIPSP